MPLVGFESTIPAFERTKTLHALDREATVTGKCDLYHIYIRRIGQLYRRFDSLNESREHPFGIVGKLKILMQQLRLL
jgi:hypothetical protein